MTCEDDFHAILDANPADHFTRLVFADWLQERDDPRAEGMRALGVLRRMPWYFSGSRDWGWWDEQYGGRENHPDSWIPDNWYFGVTIGASRREAENLAALAFSRLPAARRAELLSSALVPTEGA